MKSFQKPFFSFKISLKGYHQDKSNTNSEICQQVKSFQKPPFFSFKIKLLHLKHKNLIYRAERCQQVTSFQKPPCSFLLFSNINFASKTWKCNSKYLVQDHFNEGPLTVIHYHVDRASKSDWLALIWIYQIEGAWVWVGGSTVYHTMHQCSMHRCELGDWYGYHGYHNTSPQKALVWVGGTSTSITPCTMHQCELGDWYGWYYHMGRQYPQQKQLGF